ncbi:phage terminase large subunit [Pseudomonas chlororaphis]|uniref:phage terminase large subunit n=1 Tax=Pseudomonas chlororaphis TaxID=587753 RepID=UPI0024085373|nr:phage terminase large subunit [Pseudomonas chlororaphis]
MTSLQPLPQISAAEAAAELLRRRHARKSLQAFIKYINPDYIVSEFSIAVCAALDSFLVDMTEGLRPVLILGAPPQHGKSDIVSRYLPAYTFGRYPDKRVAGLSYGADLASDMNRDVQRIMLGPEYAVLFPDSALNKKRVVTIEVEAKRNSETFEIVGRKGSYVSQGVGGPLTGKRVDMGIIDDPIKNSKEALSQTVKDGIWNWYISTFLTRLSKYSGQIVMATRWATDDLSGKIIEKNPRAKVLAFKAISDEGEALVPALHPIDKLLETKETLGDYFWSAMYQQSPIVQGGNFFKAQWWQFYEAMPELQYKTIYADTAQKTKQQNDYSVFQCWGKTKGGQAVLVDMVRGKWEAPELLVQARAFWNKHRVMRPICRAFKIEDKVSGTGLIQTLRREGVPVQAIERDRDKITRAYDAAPLVESGNVLLPREAPWLSDFLSECSQFPSGTHDDQVDPMMDAVSDILQGRGRPIRDML